MAKKVALGKGIASLLQSSPPAIENHNNGKKILEKLKKTNSEKVVEKEFIREIVHEPLLVDVSLIKANSNQPRKIFKDKELEELAQSIRENGVLQPVLVTKVEKGYEIIAGERRLRATKLAGVDKIPVVIKHITDKEKMVFAILENVQRSDLNCIEEALAYFQLMEDFHLTQEEVAKKIGKERSTIANYLRILKLPRNVIELVQKELLSFGHAKVLVAVTEREKVIRAASVAVEKNMSVRELEKYIKLGKFGVPETKEKNFFDERIDGFKQSLEKKTGHHFSLKTRKNGAGEISIKFSNEAEFNDIFAYLMK